MTKVGFTKMGRAAYHCVQACEQAPTTRNSQQTQLSKCTGTWRGAARSRRCRESQGAARRFSFFSWKWCSWTCRTCICQTGCFGEYLVSFFARKRTMCWWGCAHYLFTLSCPFELFRGLVWGNGTAPMDNAFGKCHGFHG